MRYSMLAVAVLVVGCGSSSPIAGLPLSIQEVDGGLLFTTESGATAFLSNGAKGERGLVGAQGVRGEQGERGIGEVGPVGPMGPRGADGRNGVDGHTPQSPTLFGADGGVIGYAIFNGNFNNMSEVYLKDTGCIANIDWDNNGGNQVRALPVPVLFEGPSCSGVPFVLANSSYYFPSGCFREPNDPNGTSYKAMQPMQPRHFVAGSRLVTGTLEDGGTQTQCQQYFSSGTGIQVTQITMPVVSFPVTVGMR